MKVRDAWGREEGCAAGRRSAPLGSEHFKGHGTTCVASHQAEDLEAADPDSELSR